jgi:hypothetical protein
MIGKEDGKPMSAMADAQQKTRARAEEFATDLWQQLLDVDDRTSPEDYPDHALITRDELLVAAASCSFCDRLATRDVDDCSGPMAACDGCAEAWATDPGFMKETPPPPPVTASPQTVALRTIVQLIGNVDHRRATGDSPARYYGDMLEDIRVMACHGLGARPEVVQALMVTDRVAKALEEKR